jgi:hypothetical protein
MLRRYEYSNYNSHLKIGARKVGMVYVYNSHIKRYPVVREFQIHPGSLDCKVHRGILGVT